MESLSDLCREIAEPPGLRLVVGRPGALCRRFPSLNAHHTAFGAKRLCLLAGLRRQEPCS
jgi:hypothetical protein